MYVYARDYRAIPALQHVTYQHLLDLPKTREEQMGMYIGAYKGVSGEKKGRREMGGVDGGRQYDHNLITYCLPTPVSFVTGSFPIGEAIHVTKTSVQ